MARLGEIGARSLILVSFALVAACGAAPVAPTVSPDPDGDGIGGASDRCADGAEDRDGFEDDDGCPDPDNDQDGVSDVDDACPDDMEDRDGYEDEDGCPDLDNDLDRIFDVDDECPDEPETYNGREDADGCPDSGCVLLLDNRLAIEERIYFEPGSAELTGPANPVLDALAEVMRTYRRLRVVAVHGHRALRGEPPRLAIRRAEAVRDALVERGVESERLRVSEIPGPALQTDDEHNRVVTFDIEERSYELPPIPCGQRSRRPLEPEPWERAGLDAPPEPVEGDR